MVKKPTATDIKALVKAKDTYEKAIDKFKDKYDVDASYIRGLLSKPTKG